MYNRLKYLLFSFIPVVSLLLVLELAFGLLGWGKPFILTSSELWYAPLNIMIKDQYSGYRLEPNASVGSLKINSLGFRDDELNRDADIKILCMGDSVAFGWGIHVPHDTYCGQLEQMLNESLSSRGVSVEAFNGGVPSYQLYQGFELYLSQLSKVAEWDLVIASYGWNDSTHDDDEALEFIRRNPPEESPLLRSARKSAERLRTYNLLYNLYRNLTSHNQSDQSRFVFDRYSELYRKFISSVKQHNSEIILLSCQIREEDPDTSYTAAMTEFNKVAQEIARQENIVFVDTDPLFKADRPGWYDNVHFDEQGHLITANALYKPVYDIVLGRLASRK